MAKTIKRYDNGIVQLEYIPLEMRICLDLVENCTNAEIGELIRALIDREKAISHLESAVDETPLPALKGNGRWYVHSVVGGIEAIRESRDSSSETNRKNGSQSHKGDKREPSIRPTEPRRY